MKRLLRGSVILAVAVGFISCSGDPTSGFRDPQGIVANPTSVFVNVGETKPVVVSLQDDQGNQIAADYTLSDVGPGITVVRDTAFQHTNAGSNIANQQRFQVTGNAIANSSFKLTAGAISQVIAVRVTPATVDIGISNPTPAFGDTITLTAPAGALFTDSSEVTFGGGPPGDIVRLSPDRTMLIVVPGPNTLGVVTVAHTTVSFDQGLDFTITSATGQTVTSPTLTNLEGATFSTQTPALGAPVTLTLPAGVKVLPVMFLPPTSVGTVDSLGVLADSGLIIEGAINPRAVTVSPDSSMITFIPAPNSDSVLTIHGIVVPVLPQFPLILQTTLKLTSPVVDSLPATISSTAPNVNVPVVLTSTDGSFTFVDPAVIAVGGDSTPIVTGQTANTITFLPKPGSTGKVGVGAVDVVGFGIPLTSKAPAITTSSTVPSLPGSSSTATAPPLVVPALDGTSGIYDAGTFGGDLFGTGAPVDQVYRVNITTAGDYTFTVGWNNGSDIDVAICALADCSDADFFAATADNPESGTLTLTPGTYYLAADLFDGDPPAYLSIRIDHTATPPPAP